MQTEEERDECYLKGCGGALLFGQSAASDSQNGHGVDPNADNLAAGAGFAQAH